MVPSEIEEFTELFTDNTFFIGPYNQRDAQQMIASLAKRNQQMNFSEHTQAFMIWATGGYAGLMRAVFRAWPHIKTDALSSTDLVKKNEQVAQQLIKIEPVQAECRTIWDSLSAQERYILEVAAGIKTYKSSIEATAAAALLKKKQLLALDKDNPAELQITPPLLLYYIQGLSTQDDSTKAEI